MSSAKAVTASVRDQFMCLMQNEAVWAPEQADTAVQLASQAGAHTALQHQVQQQAAAIAAMQTQLASILQQPPPAAPRDALQGLAQATPDSSHVERDISQHGNAAPATSQAVMPMEPAASTRPGAQQAAGPRTYSAQTSSAIQSVEADCSDQMETTDQHMLPSTAGSAPEDKHCDRCQVDADRLDVPLDTEDAISQQIAPKQAQKAKTTSKSYGEKQGGVGRRTPWLTVKWCNAPYRFL